MWFFVFIAIAFIIGIVVIKGDIQLPNIQQGYIEVTDASNRAGQRFRVRFYCLKTKQIVHTHIAPFEARNLIIRIHNEGQISEHQKNIALQKISALLILIADSKNNDTILPKNYIHLDVELQNNVVYITYDSSLQQKRIRDNTTPETLKNWMETHYASKDINTTQYNIGIQGANLLEARMIAISERNGSGTGQNNVITDTNIRTGLSSGSNAFNSGGLM